jgi:hypothetical protein
LIYGYILENYMSSAPPMNCKRECKPICNTGTSTCDAQNEQACALTQQQVQSCEDAAYDKPAETFVDMTHSWIPLFVVGTLFIIYGVVKNN